MRLAVNSLFALLVAGAIAALSAVGAQSPAAAALPEPTAKYLRGPGWWPTKGDAARKDYAGTEACGSCHHDEAVKQRQTSMARAASRAADTAILRANPQIVLNAPPLLTTITRGRKGSTYTVARGGEARSGEILWSMGDGAMGRTFILQAPLSPSGASLVEGQLSYFTATRALDLTPGHTSANPRDLDSAFGQRQSPEAAKQCFACHTTASSVRGEFDPGRATPGITCEACHGPGARHADAMRQGRIDEGRAAILNPASLDPVRQLDYCGACHRTPLDVAIARDFVPINVRFQPYRLAKSRCWRQPDRRLTCAACHDPHEQVVRDSSYYDPKCLACHAPQAGTSPANAPASSEAKKTQSCPVGTTRCTSCHMPRYTVPQMHGSFTDHDIRVVREGDPYPL